MGQTADRTLRSSQVIYVQVTVSYSLDTEVIARVHGHSKGIKCVDLQVFSSWVLCIQVIAHKCRQTFK